MPLLNSHLEILCSAPQPIQWVWPSSHSGETGIRDNYHNEDINFKKFKFIFYVSSIADIVVPEEGIVAKVEITKEEFFSYSYERIIYIEDIGQLDWQVSDF